MLPRGPDPRLLLDDEFAVVGGHFAEDDLEKRGFPGTVRTDDADALALVDAESDIREDVLKSVVDGYVLEV